MKNETVETCHKCKSIIVNWNWFSSKSESIASYWVHECLVCDSVFSTENKITTGVPHDSLTILKSMYDKGLPVSYNKAMKILYDKNQDNKLLRVNKV